MLAWKWWRDCRGRVILYLGAALAFGVLAALDATVFNWWMLRYGNDPVRLHFYMFLTWNRIGYSLSSPTTLGAAWMGLALAISSMGRDYASPAGSFLLTRPRSRVAMLWLDWALSQGTVILAAALLIGSAVAVALRVLPFINELQLWTAFPIAVAIGVVVYGLTLFWTVATRNAVRGVELTIATILVATLSPSALLEWWHIAWPDHVQRWMMRIFEWSSVQWYWLDHVSRRQDPKVAHGFISTPMVYHTIEPYPFAALAIWIGLGLALTYATQKIMERREV